MDWFVKIEITLWIAMVLNFGSLWSQESKDYCSWETFNPTCEQNQVVIIQKALYGLMKKGRCVKRDFGFLGCSSDELAFLDKECSGRRTCEVLVGNEVIKANIPCPDHYLEASYICKKVTVVDENQCNSAIHVQVKSAPNYIASITSLESNCGLGSSPWLLTAHPGQRINLTLINYSWGDITVPRQQNGKCDVIYGHVLSDAHDDMIEICGGQQRKTHLKLITSNQVQIVLQETAVQTHQFLIQFEGIGCADIIPPKNTWMRKDNNDLTIGCHTSTDMWRMKCIGNHWIGTMGNCSEATIKQPIAKSPKIDFSHHHVAAVAVGCLALIICCITITVGGYFVRRYKIKVKSGYNKSTCDMHLLPSTQFTTVRPNTNNTISQNSTYPVRQFTLSHQPPNADTGTRPSNYRFMDSRTTLGEDASPQYFILEPPTGNIENNIF